MPNSSLRTLVFCVFFFLLFFYLHRVFVEKHQWPFCSASPFHLPSLITLNTNTPTLTVLMWAITHGIGILEPHAWLIQPSSHPSNRLAMQPCVANSLPQCIAIVVVLTAVVVCSSSSSSSSSFSALIICWCRCLKVQSVNLWVRSYSNTNDNAHTHTPTHINVWKRKVRRLLRRVKGWRSGGDRWCQQEISND